MKLLSYREALKLSKEAIDATLIPLRALKARKKAELEMATLDEAIAVLEHRFTEECMAKDICFSSIIALQDQLALKTRTKRQYQEILDQMFPTEDKE